LALWLERLREVAEQEWQPVTGSGLVAFLLVFLPIAWLAHTGERWVPLLDSANLAFHEAGHPLVGLFSERLAVYGGTLAQLAFPLVVTGSFWTKRSALGFAFGLGWFAQNLWNIARYMADARTQALPLIGGGEHDWTEILLRWGALDADASLAGLTRVLGWAVLLGAGAWLFRRRLSDEG
jgi:hypothetical protein